MNLKISAHQYSILMSAIMRAVETAHDDQEPVEIEAYTRLALHVDETAVQHIVSDELKAEYIARTYAPKIWREYLRN